MPKGIATPNVKTKVEKGLCKYELDHEGKDVKLIIRCRDCDGDADLKSPMCLTGILRALSSETNVNAVVLSSVIERMYTDSSMELLDKMVCIGRELEQLSVRDPAKEHFSAVMNLTSSQLAKQEQICRKCDRNPQNIFPALKETFVKDVMDFYKQFVTKVQNNRPPFDIQGCMTCISTTQKEFVYLYNYMEKARADIIYLAYRIDLRGGANVPK
jgi:hypothetical protein